MRGILLAVELIVAICATHAHDRSRPLPSTAREVTLTRWLLWASFAALAHALFMQAAFAESATVGRFTSEFTMFDSIEDEAHTTSSSWFSAILVMVRPTFLLLATIEICWAAAIWAFEKDNLNSLAVEVIKKIMFIGFFFALLQFAPEWIPTIANSFQEVGQRASGVDTVSTDGIIATGLALIQLIWSDAPSGLFDVLGKLGQILVACFVTLGIIIAYVVLAAQYFTLKVESYILFAAGAIFLGLGSSSWTNDYVSKYLNYAINVGVRILVLILVLSLMLATVERLSDGYEFEYEPLLKMLAVAVLQAILGIKAPEMAGALLGGGPGLTAGGASGAMSSTMGRLKSSGGLALGAAGAAMGAARTAAAKGVSAAQGVGNLSKAVGAGRDQAMQQGKGRAAATVSGLGAVASHAAGQARAAAKALPGKMIGAIKGKSERGKNPGFLDRAKQGIRAGGVANEASKMSASLGGSPGASPGGSPGGSPGASPGSGPANTNKANPSSSLRKATAVNHPPKLPNK